MSSASPHRPSAAEYAAYSAILHDLDIEHRHDLAAQLVRERKAHRQPSSQVESEEQDDVSVSATSTVLRRIDGPAFAPVYQDAAISRKRKRRAHEQRKSKQSSTLWPLAPSELPGPAPQTLEEAVFTFTSSYIRTRGLALKGCQADPDDIDENPILPDDFVSSVMESVGRILVRLAGARPVEVKQTRKEMATMDWSSVLSIASMEPDLKADLFASIIRLRETYHMHEPDVLTHRLNVLDQTQRPTNPADALYASIVSKRQDRLARPHQSKAEIALREERRRLKAEKKKTRGNVKETKQTGNGMKKISQELAKKTKTKKRRRAKR